MYLKKRNIEFALNVEELIYCLIFFYFSDYQFDILFAIELLTQGHDQCCQVGASCLQICCQLRYLIDLDPSLGSGQVLKDIVWIREGLQVDYLLEGRKLASVLHSVGQLLLDFCYFAVC